MFKSGRAMLYCSERNRSTGPLGKLRRHSSSPGIQIGARSKQMMHPIPAQHAWHSLSWLMELIPLMSLEQYASIREGWEEKLCLPLEFFNSCKKEWLPLSFQTFIPWNIPYSSLYSWLTTRSAGAGVWDSAASSKRWLCNDSCFSTVVKPIACAQGAEHSLLFPLDTSLILLLVEEMLLPCSHRKSVRDSHL